MSDAAHVMSTRRSHRSRDSDGHPPRFTIRPLPGRSRDLATLKRWFRRFVEVRDSEGAEALHYHRCEVGRRHTGAGRLDVLRRDRSSLPAATGHVLDFTNKAFEAIDQDAADLQDAADCKMLPICIMLPIWPSPCWRVLRVVTRPGERMEESNQWRNPIDLIANL